MNNTCRSAIYFLLELTTRDADRGDQESVSFQGDTASVRDETEGDAGATVEQIASRLVDQVLAKVVREHLRSEEERRVSVCVHVSV